MTHWTERSLYAHAHPGPELGKRHDKFPCTHRAPLGFKDMVNRGQKSNLKCEIFAGFRIKLVENL